MKYAARGNPHIHYTVGFAGRSILRLPEPLPRKGLRRYAWSDFAFKAAAQGIAGYIQIIFRLQAKPE